MAPRIAITEPRAWNPAKFIPDSVLTTTSATPTKETVTPRYARGLSFSFNNAAARIATNIVLDATRIAFADAGINFKAEKLRFG